MIAEVVVVVTGKERKDKATPEFAEVGGGIVAKLANAIGEHRVGAEFTRRQTEQAIGRKEWNAPCSVAVEAGNDGDGLAFDFHHSVAGDSDTGLLREGEGEDLARGDVACVIGLRELCDGELVTLESNGGLGSRAPKRRALT